MLRTMVLACTFAALICFCSSVPAATINIVPGEALQSNAPALAAFRFDVKRLWLHSLRRRSQNDRTTWAKFGRLAERWLPPVCITHPWPSARFYVKYPRQEPGALVAHAGICAGGAG